MENRRLSADRLTTPHLRYFSGRQLTQWTGDKQQKRATLEILSSSRHTRKEGCETTPPVILHNQTNVTNTTEKKNMTETVDNHTHDAPDQPVEEEVTVEEPSQQSTTATTTGVDSTTATTTTTTTSSISPALNCMFAFIGHCECCSCYPTHPFANDI